MQITGSNKSEVISGQKLLSKYKKYFESLLNISNGEEHENKVVIIGYGFNDPHINEVFCKAKNSKFAVISPCQYDEFVKNKSFNTESINNFINSIERYYPCTFKELLNSSRYQNLLDWLNQ